MNIFNRQTKAVQADKNGGLIGKKWNKVYNGYFENTEIAKLVTDACGEIIKKLTADRELKILEIGAGTGVVGETVNQFIQSKGISTELTISDRLKEHLQADKNPKTKQIVFDNKKMPLDSNLYDLVLARSVTHYEPNKTQEIVVLKEVYRVLSNQGFFVSQAPTFASLEESNLLISIHNLVGKPMNLQSTQDVEKMLKEIFKSVEISKIQAPSMSVTMKGFFERYNIKSPKKETMAIQIKKLIIDTKEELRPDVRIVNNSFEWEIPYTIFICQK